jgi:hypothetical protein
MSEAAKQEVLTVEHQVTRLAEYIGALESEVDAMQGALSPVLSEELAPEPAQQKLSERDCSCPLAQQLDSMTTELRRLVWRLEDMRQRVGL